MYLLIAMMPNARSLCPVVLCCVLCIALLAVAPAEAFTADSLNITVSTNGDAIADFQYTLNGVIENAIPLSVLQDQLVQGLATSSEPPQVLSFSKSEATLLLKSFAVTNAVPTGTEYQTAPMNFSNAQAALQISAVSSVISADFSPKITTVTFPDGYSRQFLASSVLPSIDHIVVNPAQAGAALTSSVTAPGSIQVNTSPEHTQVFIDSAYVGESPGVFSGLTPGDHHLTLEADGFLTLSKNVTVTSGQTTLFVENLAYAATPTPQSAAPGAGIVIAFLSLTMCGVILLHRTK
ncbi:PEGA domain-containing protein [Methanoregula sp.]